MPEDNLDQLASSLLGEAQVTDQQAQQIAPSPVSSEDINSVIYDGLDKIKQFTQPAIEEWNTCEVPRDTGLGALPGNFVLDSVDFGKGIGALGNSILNRSREVMFDGSAPIRVVDEISRTGKKLPSDIPVAGAVGGAMLADTYNTWLRPFVDNGLDGTGDIVEHINKHPGFAAADLSIFGGVAGKGLKAAGVSDKLAATASKAKVLLPEGLKTSMAATEAARPAAQGYANAMRRVANVYDDVMQPLWDKMTKAEQKEARAYAEGWHPDIMSGQGIPESVKRFLDATEALTEKMGKTLIDAGVKTAEEIEAARYLPFILENTRLADGTKVFNNIAEITKDPAIASQYIRLAKEMLDAIGYKPKYNPWITDSEAARTIANPTKLSGQAFKEAAAQIFDLENGGKFGRFKDKASAGDKVGGNHYDNLKASFLQIAQFDSAVSTIIKQALNGVNNPTLYKGPLKKLKIAGNALVEQHIDMIFAEMGSPMPAMGSAAKALGGEILLPESVHNALTRMLHMPERIQAGFIQKWLSAQKRYLLGTSPIYSYAQGIQQAFQLLLFQFNGIHDIIPSLWSWTLAFHPELNKMIPQELVKSVQAADALSGTRMLDATGDLLEKGAKGAASVADGFGYSKLSGRIEKVGEASKTAFQGAERAVDANLAPNQLFDAMTRTVATYYFLNDIASKNPAARKVFDGMVDTAKMEAQLKWMRNNPEAQGLIKKKVDTVLGDFSSMPGKYQQIFGMCFLWARYYTEFAKFYGSFAKNHPIKNATLAHYAATSPFLFGDENLPDWAKGATMVPGSRKPDGTALVDTRGSLTPLATLGDLAGMYAGLMNQGTTDTAAILNSTPSIVPMILVMSGTNPNTLRPFKDYRLVQNSAGISFDKEDLDKGIYRPMKPTPDYIEYLARTFFAFPMKESRALFERAASGGEPSDFTSIMPVRLTQRTKNMIPLEIGFRSAPKRNSKGEIIQQRPLLQSMDEFLNMKPTSIDLTRQAQTKRYQGLELRKLRKKANRMEL